MSAIKQANTSRRRARSNVPNPFVERLAVALETDGFPRIAGRIFGLLLISSVEVSLDEIVDALGASKASASVNTRMLEDKGFIERVSRPGDRRDYYRIAADPFLRAMEQRLARWNRVRSVVTDAMTDSSIAAPARSRLKEFDAMSGECGELLEATLTRLKTRRKK
jgi:DNA-binding transcriptional regulator GbsR (MarR family)